MCQEPCLSNRRRLSTYFSIFFTSQGQVRRALNQIRRAGSALRPEHLLYNGMPAGRFALAMVQGQYIRRSRKGEKEEKETTECEECQSNQVTEA